MTPQGQWTEEARGVRVFTSPHGVGRLESVNPWPRVRSSVTFADGHTMVWYGNGNHFEREMLGIEAELST